MLILVLLTLAGVCIASPVKRLQGHHLSPESTRGTSTHVDQETSDHLSSQLELDEFDDLDWKSISTILSSSLTDQMPTSTSGGHPHQGSKPSASGLQVSKSRHQGAEVPQHDSDTFNWHFTPSPRSMVGSPLIDQPLHFDGNLPWSAFEQHPNSQSKRFSEPSDDNVSRKSDVMTPKRSRSRKEKDERNAKDRLRRMQKKDGTYTPQKKGPKFRKEKANFENLPTISLEEVPHRSRGRPMLEFKDPAEMSKSEAKKYRKVMGQRRYRASKKGKQTASSKAPIS